MESNTVVSAGRMASNMLQSRGNEPRAYVPQNATYIAQYTHGLLGVHLTLDLLLSRILWSVLGLVCVLVLSARLVQRAHQYIRLASNVDSPLKSQRFWGCESSRTWAWFKKHVLYAPIFGKRHNREMRLSKAVNCGVVPSRIHTVLILVYFLMQAGWCCILSYSANDQAALLAELRGRSGNLAVLNMIPLFIFAGRNNPLIGVLHVSFDTFNLYHRWLGRFAAMEAIVHTSAWMANAVRAHGWAEMSWECFHIPFFLTGAIGSIAMLILLLHTFSALRHAFYETFLAIHQICAFVLVVVVWFHLYIDALPQNAFYWFIPVFWFCERMIRFIRLFHMNVSRRHGLTKCTIEALPCEATRVTFELPKTRKIPAGSHVYAYFPKFSYWMNHPFSIAWAENDSDATPLPPLRSSSESSPNRRLPRSLTVQANQRLGEHGRRNFNRGQVNNQTASVTPTVTSSWFNPDKRNEEERTRVSLIIGAATGLTRTIYEAALAQPNATLHCSGFIEGPYTSHPKSFRSYGTVVLFSGGAGITHHLLHTRNLINEINAGISATRKIHLIWSVRSIESFSWASTFINQILSIPHRKKYLTIKLFVTKPTDPRDIRSLSSSVIMEAGRCKPGIILNEVMDEQVSGPGSGAVAVSVCGPGTFSDEVRHSVRNRIGQGVVLDFCEEAFSW
ncbi:hypothetical protein KEM56_001272 [Ascosphaera pollenicola]|nr:hypothetical protein KEM56_001272 [Ascosphaera pollenicola]